jgi:DNA-directed RNA polymerase
MSRIDLEEFYKAPEAHPLWERQINLELYMLRKGAEAFRSKLQDATKHNELTRMAPHRRLMQQMIEPTAQYIIKWKEEVATRRGVRPVALALLNMIDPHVASLITVRTLLDQIGASTGTRSLTGIAQQIGLSIEHECKIEEWIRLDPKAFHSINKNQKKEGSTPVHIRRVNINLYNKLAAKDVQWEEWTNEQHIRVGLQLLDSVIQATRAFEVVPDPKHDRMKRRGFKRPSLIVSPTEATATWLSDALATAEVLHPHYLPTIIPPRRWTSPKRGAYWSKFVRTPLMIRFRASQQGQHKRAIDEFMALDMKGPYGALNMVQEVGWKVNHRVLEVAKRLWQRGKGEAGLPISKPVEMPAKPHDIATNKETRRAWKIAASKVHGINARMFSQTLTAKRTLDIAEMLAGDTFYFPHMYDFRGRMYPIPVALQPQGQDLARGILTFADGKCVDGAEGWLAVQVANTWGHDKISYEERLQWVEKNREMFERIAEDPIANKEWMQADSPWQALAATFEIAAMWGHGAGYISSLPIRVDGTCNGLQHLAIMSGDAEVARAVNVLPSEQPEDIYQRVADAATEILRGPQEETIRGADKEEDLAGEWLRITEGRLPRSLAKRPVMILPYGGTMQAFTDYTWDWLEENEKPSWGTLDKFKMATFMSRLLWRVVQDRMNGPMRVMRWLRETATVAASGGAPLYWTTPAGFVVRHFYGEMKTKQLMTKLDGRHIQLRLYSPTDDLNKKDQARGIAPNFVHSQDASVLIGCVQACRAEGVESVTTIHDSFGTVAADMGKLGAILRECFILNYSEDVLGAFQDSCRNVTPKVAESRLTEAPRCVGFDVEAIRDSDYFFA